MRINFIKKNHFFIFIALFVAFFVNVSCADVLETTVIHIEPLEIVTELGDTTVNTNTIAYLFKADTLSYAIESYEDAVNGVITNKLTSAKENYFEEAVYDETINSLQFNETMDRLVLGVVCDTATKVYYYRNIETDINLEDLYLRLIVKQYVFADKPDTTDINLPWKGRNL